MPHEQDRNIRLFVDADGRLTDLLSRLKLKTSRVSAIPNSDTTRDFAFIELRNSDAAKVTRLVQAVNRPVHKKLRRSPKEQAGVSSSLLAHAVETFGSESAARDWLSTECGALNNRTPLEVIQASRNEAEVERILDCIDYGMLA